MCVCVRVLVYVCVCIIGNAHVLDVAAACCLLRVYAQYLVCVYMYVLVMCVCKYVKACM